MTTHASGRMGVRDPRKGKPALVQEAKDLEKGRTGAYNHTKQGHPTRADKGLKKF